MSDQSPEHQQSGQHDREWLQRVNNILPHQNMEPDFFVGDDALHFEEFDLIMQEATQGFTSGAVLLREEPSRTRPGVTVRLTRSRSDGSYGPPQSYIYWDGEISFPAQAFSVDMRQARNDFRSRMANTTSEEAIELFRRQFPGYGITGPATSLVGDGKNYRYKFGDVEVDFFETNALFARVRATGLSSGDRTAEHERIRAFSEVFMFVMSRMIPANNPRKYILEPGGQGRIVAAGSANQNAGPRIPLGSTALGSFEQQDYRPEPPEGVERLTPRYSLDDIGGQQNVKDSVRKMIFAHQHPEMVERWGGSRPQGLILYGEPGNGKNMFAEAIAKELDADMWVIDAKSIYEMWIGSSGTNLKRIFTSAVHYPGRLVIFFDEIDTLFHRVDGTAPGGGGAEIDTVQGLFKNYMNYIGETNPNVIFVGATNYLDRIDEPLIRSGRFNTKLYVPLLDEEARTHVFAIKLADLVHAADDAALISDAIDAPALARATDGMSGADIVEILHRVGASKAMQEQMAGSAAPISQADILEEVTNFRRNG